MHQAIGPTSDSPDTLHTATKRVRNAKKLSLKLNNLSNLTHDQASTIDFCDTPCLESLPTPSIGSLMRGPLSLPHLTLSNILQSPSHDMALPSALTDINTSESLQCYPDGPICVVPPNIYIYSTPDRDIASRFDVIINVAQEVSNPFKSCGGISPSEQYPTPCMSPDVPQVPIDCGSTTSSKTVQQPPFFSSDSNSPEYIWFPWDHDSDISKDLLFLTDTLRTYDSLNKSILVHCQCGVSRSASLVVAYVMRSQQLPLGEAYAKVKTLSPYIGPNMGLIYQLMDWEKLLKQMADLNDENQISSQTLSKLKASKSVPQSAPPCFSSASSKSFPSQAMGRGTSHSQLNLPAL
ncbi:hypothetical protein CANCADRAFT_32426 [Tortispora caseinolytica NRRL Y-17796]|uniref:protein-tyrosine-phosphatase n=1 Tax=Tortispora caseinolytica NRRL Y-17796 TaxID=767744 RepID=A0A1E4TB96_9ASCO|nr:hypothetical protein CANCADRAFT_32426 [Tortispora caseinolytica NRRL Y-17796]